MTLVTILLDVVIGVLVLAMAVTGGLWFFQSHVVPTQGWGVGQLVQVRFKGCPDVILRAAYDSNGEPANYDRSGPRYPPTSARCPSLKSLEATALGSSMRAGVTRIRHQVETNFVQA